MNLCWPILAVILTSQSKFLSVDAGEPHDTDLVQTMRGEPRFSNILASFRFIGVIETLQDGGPFTVLAPTDSAFNEFFGTDDVIDAIWDKPPGFKNIILRHIIKGEILVHEFHDGYLRTLSGETIHVHVDNSDYQRHISFTHHYGNTSVILQPDITSKNGVVHVVDKIIN